MKAIIVLIVIAVVVVFAVMFAVDYIKEENAKTRVELILNGLHDGPQDATADVQRAVSQWYEGTQLIMDRNTLSHASNQFDAWLRKKNLYKKITTYEISDASLVKGSEPPVVIVSCTIEGKSFQMEVPKGDKIKWID